MGIRTSYPPGTFSWVELVTTDAAAATAFYGALFGWTANGDGTFRLDGDAVAGLATDREGVAPGWLSAVTSGEGDDGLVTDPQGASLLLRPPSRGMGAERVNEAGCLVMNELITPDLAAARTHYEGAFGWTTEPFGEGMALVFNDGWVNASMIAAGTGPAHWRPCFAVRSIEAALGRVEALGGTTVHDPVTIPDGTLAVAADPHGAVFSLYTGELDP